MTIETTVPTKHSKLLAWVEEVAELTQPAAIHWCDGSAEEYDALCAGARRRGHVREALGRQAAELVPRAAPTRATSRASRTARSSAPSARRTPGPTNNWRDPAEMRERAQATSSTARCAGRTMYVVPF